MAADREQAEPRAKVEPTEEHEHRWVRHQNVTSRGYRMPHYELCTCGAARPVDEWA